MTVQTNTNVSSFNGDGANKVFPIGYKFNSAADLVVTLIDDEAKTTQILTLNSDFTVTGAGDEEGGVVTLVVAPTAVQRLKATRVVDILQLTDLRNQGKFYAEVHEDVFDLLIMIDQQQQTEIDDANATSDEAVAIANEANAKSDQAVAKADQNLVDMQAQYDAFEQGAALYVIGDYAAGLVISAYNQIFRKDGEFYRAAASLDLPYTLAGDWAAESASFVSVGDAVLRQELAATGGAGIVGFDPAIDYPAGTAGRVLRQVAKSIISFGVAGDGVADDSAALEAAILSGEPLDFRQLNIRVTRTLTGTILGAVNWKSSGATIFYDGASTINGVLDFDVMPGLEHRIEGKLAVDGSSLAFMGARFRNPSTAGFPLGYAKFYAADLCVENIRRADLAFENGDGIVIRGGFSLVQFDRPVVKNVKLAAGAGIVGTVGVTGITVFGTIDGYPIQTIVNDPDISDITSEDVAYSADQDGLRVFGPWFTAGGQVNSTLLVRGGQFRDCWGRSIKSQCTSSVITGTNFSRYSGPTGGGNAEIDLQVGGGVVRDIQCHYSGANSVPNEVVSFQPNENLPSFAGVLSGVKVFTTHLLDQVVSTFPRASTQHQLSVKDIDVIGPITRLLEFRVWSNLSRAVVRDCTATDIAGELVRVTASGASGSPYVGTVSIEDCVNLGTVRALVTDRVSGVAADAVVSDRGCVGFLKQSIFSSSITPKGGALRVPALLGEDVSSGSLSIFSKSIANDATETFVIPGYNVTSAAIVSFGSSNQSHGLVAVSGSGVVSLAKGTAIEVGTTTEPVSGTFRLWVSGGLLQVKNTSGSARQVTIFWMG